MREADVHIDTLSNVIIYGSIVWCSVNGPWKPDCCGSNPGSDDYLLCVLGQVNLPLCASVL